MTISAAEKAHLELNYRLIQELLMQAQAYLINPNVHDSIEVLEQIVREARLARDSLKNLERVFKNESL